MALPQRYTAEKLEIAERMITRIVESLDPERILLFGSVARREAREASDIDLVVVKSDRRSFKERMDYLYNQIEREEETDMFWYTPEELAEMAPSSSFVRRLLREAVTLYERE